MDFLLYDRLSTCSKRALRRIKGRGGRPYQYRPRGNLLQRLASETGMTVSAVYLQLMDERDALIH